MSTTDERAVEVGQFSQPSLTGPQTELAGYFEPTQIADLNRHGRLLVVADGVGGAASGEVASRFAIQKILHDYYHSREPDLEKRLLAVIRQAHTAIFERNRRFAERRPMATTLMAALVHENKLFVANVGDSRAYVVWDQDIERLTAERHPQEQPGASQIYGNVGQVANLSHTASVSYGQNRLKFEIDPEQPAAEPVPPASESVPAAQITVEGATASPPAAEGETQPAPVSPATPVAAVLETPPGPQPGSTNGPQAEAVASPAAASQTVETPALNHSTTKTQTVPLKTATGPLAQPSNLSPFHALGLTEQIEIECFSRRLFPGDAVVLCSGGLTDYVSEAEIAQTITQHPPAMASRRLAELAGKRGSRDALSVSVTRVLSKPAAQAAPARLALPQAPDWEALTRPITRPLPPLPVQPERKPADTPRRWPIYGAAVLALLLLGLVGFGVSRYWLAPESVAVESNGSPEPPAESANPTPNSTVPTSAPTAAGAAAGQPQPTMPVTPTLLAQSSSPVATPIGATVKQQTSDVITPTVPAPRPTPVPTIALPAGCENKGRFAGDVTVKDGTEFAPGEAFDKAWSVTNYGTCPWGGGYTVRFKDGDPMSGTKSIPLVERVEPEATGIITVPMTAPDAPGTYRSNWQMVDLNGQPFGPDLYVEIKVVPGIVPLDGANLTTLYDFVLNASQARWSAGDAVYTVTNAPIDRNLVIPAPQGIVVIGPTELRGNVPSPDNVLMTHPHEELGFIEGAYTLDIPLQPTDAIVGSLGLPKAAAINDDGVTFELSFKPNGGVEQLLFSKLVKYEESPVAVKQALTNVPPGQTGTFTLRVKGGSSLSYDWATWIELRLVRP